jgi:hypothetical protein
MATTAKRSRREYAIFTKEGRSWKRYSERALPKEKAHNIFSGLVASLITRGMVAEIRPVDNPPKPAKPRTHVIYDPSRPDGANYMAVTAQPVIALSGAWTDRTAAEELARKLATPQ